jgi:hypothetical protein
VSSLAVRLDQILGIRVTEALDWRINTYIYTIETLQPANCAKKTPRLTEALVLNQIVIC